ncbi:proline--tRNA ligase [Candidatus Woesearchaeota archaeon]|nr:proline--tRNA ligase [Candidatus Woesearchaeota archaeon]
MAKAKEVTAGLTVRKSEDFSEWYTQVVAKAELADYTSVSGCMVLRPYSYAIWENMQAALDRRFKQLGVQNAYFPLFIPESLFKKEAEHVKGFSPEVAWVTMAGNAELSERLAIRPTSETIMYESYAKWVRSWRDLPLLINQWCSVVRWEFKYPKPFLRTREFLWQEGHTVHETEKDADDWTLTILKLYTEFVQDYLAIPVLTGKKSEAEKFAGALYTTTMEALMPDGKCLQMGTSHNLGQNFAKAFGIRFLGRDGKEHLGWQTSWGVSTRTIGALIMVHGDDKGLVLPPRIAPLQAVIVPILFEDSKDKVLKACRQIQASLGKKISAKLDERESYSPGWKYNEWELKGVPLRIEVGPKDVEKKQVIIVRRDTGEKLAVKETELPKKVPELLEEIQKSLYDKAEKRLKAGIAKAGSWSEFAKAGDDGKIVSAFFCGSASCEARIKEHKGITSRAIPFDQQSKGECVKCGKPGLMAYFGKSY